ncbi:MAG: methyltransferase family protein [Promethearchaeota archaeon]
MVVKPKHEKDLKEMSTWGIGPKMFLISIPFILLFAFLSLFFDPIFQFPGDTEWLLILGLVWMFLGFIVLLISRRTIKRIFRENKLITIGIYGYVRDPIYATWILGISPGIALIFQSWILCFIPLVLYIVYRILIPIEEKFLENKYGDEYLSYKKHVWRIIPHLKPYKKNQN